MSAQLAYAEFLIAASGPCAERLERAQEQLGSVEASPKTPVMFPVGSPQIADLEYRMHLARAQCGSGSDRSIELQLAAKAARRAIELYRAVFDYHSMAVMQFDASVVLHQLGDSAAALAALETALDMDREYGFRDDAQDNYSLLLAWRGEPSSAARVSELMRDFPQRQVTLKFGWRPTAARTTFADDRTSLADGRILDSQSSATLENHIEANAGGGWSVTHRLTAYEPGVRPQMPASEKPSRLFPPTTIPAVDFRVGSTGALEGVIESKALSTRLVAQASGIVRADPPSGDQAGKATSEDLEAVSTALSSGMLEAETAQNYQIETAMWVGTTLEQSTWYQMSAPFSLPGIPDVIVEHQVEFAFTRRVPCTATDTAGGCVELVLRARPDQHAIDGVIADFDFKALGAFRQIRLVVDPTSLFPYVHEEWISLYGSSGERTGETFLQSEHLVTTTTYGPD